MQVIVPITSIIDLEIWLDSSISGDRIMSKKTPAVTIVAACIRAETGVGPSIASGNHTCKPNCADFPIQPIQINTTINVIECN